MVARGNVRANTKKFHELAPEARRKIRFPIAHDIIRQAMVLKTFVKTDSAESTAVSFVLEGVKFTVLDRRST